MGLRYHRRVADDRPLPLRRKRSRATGTIRIGSAATPERARPPAVAVDPRRDPIPILAVGLTDIEWAMLEAAKGRGPGIGLLPRRAELLDAVGVLDRNEVDAFAGVIVRHEDNDVIRGFVGRWRLSLDSSTRIAVLPRGGGAPAPGLYDVLLPGGELSPALFDLTIRAALRQRRLGSELRELRDRFSLAIRGANDGMWEWDLARERIYFSQRWRQLLGLAAEDVGDQLHDWLDRVHTHDQSRLKADLDATIAGEKTMHESEHRIRAGDGSWRWVLTRGVVQRDGRGRAMRLSGSLTDVTEYRARERQLHEQSKHDALTDLPRREAFVHRLARAVELARDHGDYNFAVLLLNVDRFAKLRDSLGIKTADEVLARLARRLERCIGEEDFIARFEGNTFALLLENLEDPGEGTRVAGRIHAELNEPFDVDGDQVFLSVSIGMTSSARAYDRVDDVLTDANTALGKAKARAKDQPAVFDTQMRIEAMTLLRLEMNLRQAVERGEFVLHYQPLFDLHSRQLFGFEALIRWIHPKRGMVSPGEFIPVAENTGLIVQMGRWAIGEAARQVAEWSRDFGVDPRNIAVAVNMSGKQVADKELPAVLERAMTENRLPPGALKIELTESVLMEGANNITDLLNELRDRGVSIFIDPTTDSPEP